MRAAFISRAGDALSRSSPKPSVEVLRQSSQWKAVPRVAALVRKAAVRAVGMAGITVLDGAEIAVVLADNAKIQVLNREWRAVDKPTNVLSFPGTPVERLSSAPFLGDIIIAFETVAREAETEHKPLDHHLSHLIVHGVLHLLGYDHMTRSDAERMEHLERIILASLAIPDPYGDSDLLESTTA
jgi:probable rRNA maturation factor